MIPFIQTQKNVGLDPPGESRHPQLAIGADQKAYSRPIGDLTPGHNRTGGARRLLDPGRDAKSIRTENALITIDAHIVISVEFQRLVEDTLDKLRIAVDRPMTVIAGHIQNMPVKRPPAHKIHIGARARRHHTQH